MRAVELFCGAGGFSFGMKQAGIRVVRAYDVWEPALQVYRKNMPASKLERAFHIRHHARNGDIGDILALVPAIVGARPDIIFGGPPCQDFSGAGDRVEGTRADMTLAFAMAICIVRPEWILMENVPLAATSQAWRNARVLLRKAGYGLTETVEDASLHGVPQSRRRLIVVGRLEEADDFLLGAIEAARSVRPMSVREALGEGIGARFYLHPRNRERKGIHSSDGASPTIRSASKRPVPENYQPHKSDDLTEEIRLLFSRPYSKGRGVRTTEEPFPTIIRTSRERAGRKYLKAPHADDLVPAALVPSITFEQMSRIQGFPAGWDWTWTAPRNAPAEERFNKRNQDQMVANAVPPPLALAIGRVVMTRANGAIPRIETEFSEWLVAKGIAAGQTLRNKRSHLNKARRFLKGRMLADVDLALGRLETSKGFETLSPSLKSDLRSALRLHHQWRMEIASPRRLEDERARFGGFTEEEFVAQLQRDQAMEEESMPCNSRIAESLRLRREVR